MRNETLFGRDDGLLIPEVGPWTEDKFDLIRRVAQVSLAANAGCPMSGFSDMGNHEPQPSAILRKPQKAGAPSLTSR